MISKNPWRIIFLTITLFSVLFFSNHFTSRYVFADQALEQKKEDNLKKQAEIRQLLEDTRNKKSTLQNEIAYQDNQIKLTQLKIEETQNEIENLSGQIDKLEGVLTDLSDVFAQRAVETYKLKRTGDSLVALLTSNNVADFISRFEYLQRIQENDRQLLLQMQTTQTNYVDQRTKVQALEEKLQSQNQTLASQKAQKTKLLEVTKNDEQKYQKLLADAIAQMAALNRFVNSQGGASLLSNQTKCNDWGCYYNQRDSSWGGMPLGNSQSYSLADSGCLVSSVSMVASHYHKDIKPNDIALLDSAFFPEGTGNLSWSFSVKGVSVSITSASSSQLDTLLSSGPVIAGLFRGPDHFIVILRKEGSNYIMSDPFLENGGERNFSDKYSVSNITSLRLVQFN